MKGLETVSHTKPTKSHTLLSHVLFRKDEDLHDDGDQSTFKGVHEETDLSPNYETLIIHNRRKS